MGILFKTYNKKEQLHLYNEVWVIPSRHQLDELLEMFPKTEMSKIKINPVGNNIELEINGLIISCKDTKDLKQKFGHLVDLKEKFQKTTSEPKKKKS